MLFGIACIYRTCSVEADRFMMCYSVTKFTDGSQLVVDVCLLLTMRFIGEYLKKCFSSYAVIASCKQISPEAKCKGSYHLIVIVHSHIGISALYAHYFGSFLFK